MVEPITLASTVRVSGPISLRKLRRKADWGSRETPMETRVIDVQRLVFLCDPKQPCSLYRVETDEELQRVVVGLNGGIPSLTIDSDFITVLPAELDAAGICAKQTPGRTLCRFANSAPRHSGDGNPITRAMPPFDRAEPGGHPSDQGHHQPVGSPSPGGWSPRLHRIAGLSGATMCLTVGPSRWGHSGTRIFSSATTKS